MTWLQSIVDMITFPSPPSSYSLVSHRELFFVQNGNAPVPCMLYSLRSGSPLLVVYCHSNGCDIGDMHAALHCMAESFHCHLLSFEFPGYGLYEGKSSMKTIDNTCNALLDYLENVLRVDLSRVVWYGRSIGSGPAINMANVCASRGIEPAGLIVQCGFCNFKEVARFLFGRVAKRLVAHKWDNERLIARLKCPVLILHGKKDKMIPPEHAERLWESVVNKERSKLILCHCGHNDFNFHKCTLRPIHEFLYTIKRENPSTLIDRLTIPANCRPMVSHIGILRLKVPAMAMKRYNLDQIERITAHSAVTNLASVKQITVSDSDTGIAPAEEKVGGLSSLRVEQTDEKDVVLSMQPLGENGLRSDNAKDALDAGHDAATDNVIPDFNNPSSLGGAAEEEPKRGRKVKITGIKRKPDEKEKRRQKERRHCACGDAEKNAEVCIVCYDAECQFYRKGINPEDANHLLNVRALVHAITTRLVTFLYALREDLEMEIAENGSLTNETPLEQVVEWVEAQYWIRDPFLNLYEELIWVDGKVNVEYVLGPYRLTQTHWEAKEYDGKRTRPSDSLHRVRIPVWCYMPTPVHFRFITEWIMLSSTKLREFLPDPLVQKSSKKVMEKEKEQNVAPDDFAAAFASHFGAWVSEPRGRAILDKFGTLCGGLPDAPSMAIPVAAVQATADKGGLAYWLRPRDGGLPPLRQFLQRENQSLNAQQYISSAFMNPAVPPLFFSEEEIVALFSTPSKRVHIARNADYFAANILSLLESVSRIRMGTSLVPALNRSMQFVARNSFSASKRGRRRGAPTAPLISKTV
eukprot:GEMP01003426.1.p1 GENE.GEMP01003426.1~~GEMP01003426.1.p1  ORF type:complete len:807 (+),score=148.58 GEMP01003426.1:245-2665(+)